MSKSISGIALLALTAFYSVNLQAQPGPRGPQFPQRGPGANGPETRRPVTHGQHGPSRGDAHHRLYDGDHMHDRPSQSRPPQSRPPQSRPSQSRPSHGPQQRGPQQRGPQYHGPQYHGPQHDRPQSRPSHSRPSHGPAVHGRQDRGPQQHPHDRHHGFHSNAPRGPQSGPGQRPPQGKPQARPSYSRPSYDSRNSRPSTSSRPSTMSMRIPPEVQDQLGRIKAAVAAGQLSKTEAAEKIAAVRKKLGARKSQNAPQSKPAYPAKPQTQQRPQDRPQDARGNAGSERGPRPAALLSPAVRAEAGRLMMELRKAVESGEITREQAMERFNQWRKRFGTQAPQSGRPLMARPQSQRRPDIAPLPAQAIRSVKQVPAQPIKAAEGRLKKESIPATKIQPSKVFQLPPEKK